MSNMQFLCCNKCFEQLGRKNTKAAKLWLDLCSIYLKEGGPFSIKNFDSAESRYLEQRGYIITTEDEDHISIKIKGHSQDQNLGDLFCINPKEHVHD